MKNQLIIAKFGGSSMADAVAIRRSCEVTKAQRASVMVVSATYGTTNTLIQLAKCAETEAWEASQKLLEEISERHLKIARDLEADAAAIAQIESILGELATVSRGINLLRDCSKKALDTVMGVGERLSSQLGAVALAQLWPEKRVENFDIRKIMRTDDQFGKGAPQLEEIKALCQKHMIDCKYGDAVYVTQGFIGATAEGATTTLGRGGSDYSATLIGEGIGADIVQIWTDVAGIASTDPRICAKARPISEITFKEAAELASFGAKVLHPTTLAPAMRAGIPVFVGSSYEPEKSGTWIRSQCEGSPLVRALTIKKDQSLLTLSTPKMLQGHGFLFNIFKIFNDHKVSVDSITTSEISVALTVDDSTLLNKAFLQDLSQFADVALEENLSLVSLIGNRINHTPGLGQKVFNALALGVDKGARPINVRMICLGASKHNFCFLVDENDAAEAVTRLHATFIEEGQGQ